MSDHQIVADKITKPFQMLAAWLAGLVIVNGAFLAAATQVSSPRWLAAVLVIAAVVNVPLFLFCIFLLQTRFRPEMQEDSYYSAYLERKYHGMSVEIAALPPISEQTRASAAEVVKELQTGAPADVGSIQKILLDSQIDQIAHRAQDNRSLSEVFLRPEKWPVVLARWQANRSFIRDWEELQRESLVPPDCPISEPVLTDTGRAVAMRQQELGISFAQRKPHVWNRALESPQP